MQPDWTRLGGAAGLLAVAGYLALLVAPMPAMLRRTVFSIVPLAGILLVTGLGRVLRGGIAAQIATLFGIIGFALMNAVAVVQLSIHMRMRKGVPAGRLSSPNGRAAA